MSFMSAAVNKKIGNNWCLFLGGLGHTSFIASTILPSWRLDYPYAKMDNPSSFVKALQSDTFIKIAMFLGSALNGLGASILWLA